MKQLTILCLDTLSILTLLYCSCGADEDAGTTSIVIPITLQFWQDLTQAMVLIPLISVKEPFKYEAMNSYWTSREMILTG